MGRVVLTALSVLLLTVLAGGVQARAPITTGSGGTFPGVGEGCTILFENDYYVNYSCQVWGPGSPTDPRSWDTIDLGDGQRFTTSSGKFKCTDAQRINCGCPYFTQSDVTLAVPSIEGYDPAIHGIPTNIKGVVAQIHAGKDHPLVVTQDGAVVAELSAADATDDLMHVPKVQHQLTMEQGDNTFTLKNSGVPSSAHLCARFDYTFTFWKSGNGNQQLCQQQGGEWMADVKPEFEENRCCGDAQSRGVGQDFLSIVERQDGSKAMCVRAKSGTGTAWKWVKKPADQGSLVAYEIDYANTEGTSVYKDAVATYGNDGPRVCGPDMAPFYGEYETPERLMVDTISRPAGGADVTIGTTTRDFGFLCASNMVNAVRTYVVLVCTGNVQSPAAFSDSKRVIVKGTEAAEKPDFDQSATFYCSVTGNWTDDADSDPSGTVCTSVGLAQQATLQANNPNAQPTMTWTGSMCCGDDRGEYYNDPAVLDPSTQLPKYAGFYRACWNGTAVPNDPQATQSGSTARKYFPSDLVPNDPYFGLSGPAPRNRTIVAFNGSFHGCGLPADDPLLAKKWCKIEKFCKEEGGTAATTISEVSSFCEEGTLRTCDKGCENAICKDGEVVCSADKTKIEQWKGSTGSAQTLTTCPAGTVCDTIPPGSPPACYDTSAPANQVIELFEFALGPIPSAGCRAAVLRPVRAITSPTGYDFLNKTTCWSGDEPKIKSSSCYPVSFYQKNVYTPAGKTKLDRCAGWVKMEGIITDKTKQFSQGGIGDTTNLFANVSRGLGCTCGVVLTDESLAALPAWSTTNGNKFTLQCRKKKDASQPCFVTAPLVRCLNESNNDRRTVSGNCPSGTTQNAVLGYVPTDPIGGMIALQQQVNGNDYMTSLSASEGAPTYVNKGMIAYAWQRASPRQATIAAGETVDLYRCFNSATGDHFDSIDMDCEQGVDIDDTTTYTGGISREDPAILIWKTAPGVAP